MTTWVTATVLQVLAQHQLGRAGASFDAAELDLWVKGLISSKQRVHATTRLCALGFLKHAPVLDAQRQRQDRYTVTGDGAAAITEAARGMVRKSGPKGHRAPNPIKPESLVARLWALVRMRRIVDSDTATQTLCDAGEDFKRVAGTVRKYLRRWAAAGALDESAMRVGAVGTSNGCKRYVLREGWECSATPPAWRQIARQQAQEAAQ